MSVTVTTLTPGIGLSPVLGCVYFSLVEISRLRVNTSLVHVKLVDFHRVTVVKVASGMVEGSFVRSVVV